MQPGEKAKVAPSVTAGPRSIFASTFAGAVGGVCTVVAGHPFETIKLRLQMASAGPLYAPSSSMYAVAASIWNQGGVRGLYRGASAPLASSIPSFALYFWGFEVGSKLVKSARGQDQHSKLSLAGVAAAGGFSAIPATLVLTPFERVKVLLQMQGVRVERGLRPEYFGALDCVVKVVASGGVKSLFRGWEATLLRDVPGSALWFMTYEGVKARMTPTGQAPSLSTILLAGGLAGCSHWLLAIPADVLKSRLQSAEKANQTLLDCYRQVVQNGGYRRLYAGLGPALLRAFPANAACFGGVELTKRAFDSWGIP